MIAALLVSLLPTQALAADAPSADPAWSHIVNGKEVSGDRFPSAVAIGFAAQGFVQASCSASLITPRMLVTAAHCTEELGVPRNLIVQFGAAFLGNEVNTATAVGFKAFEANPAYSGSGYTIKNDIGVITLDEDVVGVDPVWFNMGADLDWDVNALVAANEAVVTSVGYGITSSAAQNSSGIKRFADLTIDTTDRQFLYSDAQTNPNQAGVCSGDSGGPQYFDPSKLPADVLAEGLAEGRSRRVQQWSVHSFVFLDNNTGANGDPCKAASGSTRIDAFNDFVLGHVEEEYGTTDFCAINGWYADRTCDPGCAEPDPDCVIDGNADGLVDADEFDAVDRNNDGVLDERELARIGGCSQTGGSAGWLPLLGLLALGLRRRQG